MMTLTVSPFLILSAAMMFVAILAEASATTTATLYTVEFQNGTTTYPPIFGVTQDTGPLQSGDYCNFSDPLLIELSQRVFQGCGPADRCTLRVGGTSQDSAEYIFVGPGNASIPPPRPTHPFKGVINSALLDVVGDFAQAIGAAMVFGVNFGPVVRDSATHQWNATKARVEQLLGHIKRRVRRYRVSALAAGNEPNLYAGQDFPRGLGVTGQVFANDVRHFSNILAEARTSEFAPTLNACDVAYSPGVGDFWFLLDFAKTGLQYVSTLTWHFYPLYSASAPFPLPPALDPWYGNSPAKMLQPAILGQTRTYARQVRDIRDQNGARDLQIVLSETASCYGGGCKGISNSFADSFDVISKVGESSAQGTSQLWRQNLCARSAAPVDPQPGEFSSWYTLLIKDALNTPNPSYFTIMLVNRLVGRSAFPVSLPPNTQDETPRVHAYCQRNRSMTLLISIMSLQLSGEPQVASVKIFGSGNSSTSGKLQQAVEGEAEEVVAVETWTLSPGQQSAKLTSGTVALNGRVLDIHNTATSAVFRPVRQKFPLKNHSVLQIPLRPLEIIFVAVRDSRFGMCL